MDEKRKIPVLIVIYTVIILLSQLGVVYTSFFDPGLVYSGPGIDLSNQFVTFLIYSQGAGYIGLFLVMLAAFIRRDTHAMATLFVFGFIANTIVILVLSNAFGIGTVGRNIIRWVVLGLPQIIVAIVLHARFEQKGQKAKS